jgi:hypothetical protein
LEGEDKDEDVNVFCEKFQNVKEISLMGVE